MLNFGFLVNISEKIDPIINWDIRAFHFINETLSNPIFDAVLPLLREKFIWIPLYLGLIYFWLKTYGRKGAYLILALAITVAVSDQISAHIIKQAFHRLRPCQNIEGIHHIIRRIDCGTGFSFVSSHAANHFAIAAFVALWFRKNYPKIEPWLYFWAGIISFAQVYIGVHYPLDVLSGALIGLILGWMAAYWTLRILKIPEKIPVQKKY